MKNLLQRIVTGGFFGIIIYGSLFAGTVTFFIVYLSIMVLALHEFYSHKSSAGLRVQKYTGLLASALLFAGVYGYASGHISLKWLSLLLLIPPLMMIRELYRKDEKTFDSLAATFYGIIYIAVPLSLLSLLVYPDGSAGGLYEPGLLAGVFILIMLNDSVAFLVGVPFGRRRLFKSVSPKKSWEGTVGGGLSVIIAAFFINRLFPVLGTTEWIVVAFITVVFGIYGDLVESLLKRRLGIKDSGKLLPGHGGVLDRLDAWFFVIPVVWVYLNFIF